MNISNAVSFRRGHTPNAFLPISLSSQGLPLRSNHLSPFHTSLIGPQTAWGAGRLTSPPWPRKPCSWRAKRVKRTITSLWQISWYGTFKLPLLNKRAGFPAPTDGLGRGKCLICLHMLPKPRQRWFYIQYWRPDTSHAIEFSDPKEFKKWQMFVWYLPLSTEEMEDSQTVTLAWIFCALWVCPDWLWLCWTTVPWSPL